MSSNKWMIAIALLLASCGDSTSAIVDAGGVDAAREDSAVVAVDGGDIEDSGVVAQDAGVSEEDAAVPVDSGPDLVDAGLPDRDADGVPDDHDCAPDDNTVGASADRSCATACGEGTETCVDGAWSACSAPTSCLCDTADATRLVSCGNCGMQSERCVDGVWTAQSGCIGQGPCSAGSVESEPLSYCATRQRICLATCQWSEWTQMVPEGAECPTPGSQFCRYSATPRGVYRCSDMCRWTYIGPCP